MHFYLIKFYHFSIPSEVLHSNLFFIMICAPLKFILNIGFHRFHNFLLSEVFGLLILQAIAIFIVSLSTRLGPSLCTVHLFCVLGESLQKALCVHLPGAARPSLVQYQLPLISQDQHCKDGVLHAQTTEPGI